MARPRGYIGSDAGDRRKRWFTISRPLFTILVSGFTIADVFEEYTVDLDFRKTRVVVKLFSLGVRFISRSEAGRVVSGLERFSEAILDFKKVEEVGQGFADEVFRVWAEAHPATKLLPVNMTVAVAFMVERSRKRRTQ